MEQRRWWGCTAQQYRFKEVEENDPLNWHNCDSNSFKHETGQRAAKALYSRTGEFIWAHRNIIVNLVYIWL